MDRVVVPHAPSSAALVRREVVSDLHAQGVDRAVVDDIAVVVSELVGNAVRHGRPLDDGTLTVEWNVNTRVAHVEVHDGGVGPQTYAPAPSPWATGGRGLLLVEELSASWGVRRRPGVSVVWAEVPLPAPRPARSASRTA